MPIQLYTVYGIPEAASFAAARRRFLKLVSRIRPRLPWPRLRGSAFKSTFVSPFADEDLSQCYDYFSGRTGSYTELDYTVEELNSERKIKNVIYRIERLLQQDPGVLDWPVFVRGGLICKPVQCRGTWNIQKVQSTVEPSLFE